MISETRDLYLLKNLFGKNFIFVIYDMSYQHNTLYVCNTSLSSETLHSLTFPFKLLELDCLNASLSLILLLFKTIIKANSFMGRYDQKCSV